MLAQAPTLKQQITVKVTRDNKTAAGWRIESSHPYTNDVMAIVPFLPTESQRIAKEYRGYTLDYGIRHCGIAPAIWQDAIAQHVAAMMVTQVEPSEPTVVQPFTEDAYLAMGNGIYKLQPVAVAPACKALAAARKRGLAITKQKCNVMIEDANRSVASIIAEANKRLAEATAEREAVKKHMTPPSWTLGQQVCYTDGRWWVSSLLEIHISQFMFVWDAGQSGLLRRKKWNALLAPPYRVRYWVRLNDALGRYNINACTLDKACNLLPHMKYTASCMAPATYPSRIHSIATLTELTASIQRCFSVVDLSSLYTGPLYWAKEIRAFCPPQLMNVLDHDLGGALLRDFPADSTEDINVDTEARQTFTATPTMDEGDIL